MFKRIGCATKIQSIGRAGKPQAAFAIE